MSSKAMMPPHPFVMALQHALGLPKGTTSFELRCAAGEAVTIRCTYLAQADGTKGFDPRPLLAHYKLVPASIVTTDGLAECHLNENVGGAPGSRPVSGRISDTAA